MTRQSATLGILRSWAIGKQEVETGEEQGPLSLAIVQPQQEQRYVSFLWSDQTNKEWTTPSDQCRHSCNVRTTASQLTVSYVVVPLSRAQTSGVIGAGMEAHTEVRSIHLHNELSLDQGELTQKHWRKETYGYRNILRPG